MILQYAKTFTWANMLFAMLFFNGGCQSLKSTSSMGGYFSALYARVESSEPNTFTLDLRCLSGNELENTIASASFCGRTPHDYKAFMLYIDRIAALNNEEATLSNLLPYIDLFAFPRISVSTNWSNFQLPYAPILSFMAGNRINDTVVCINSTTNACYNMKLKISAIDASNVHVQGILAWDMSNQIPYIVPVSAIIETNNWHRLWWAIVPEVQRKTFGATQQKTNSNHDETANP